MRARPLDRAWKTTMKSLLRPLAFALATAFGMALPASASTFSVDYTDLWYNPSENGWGLNLIQQNNAIFATLFVYGSDNTARWYVASDLESSNGTNFTGVLYRTTGPYFGASWTAGPPYTPTPAGSMSITFNSNSSATVTYTADNVTVTKSVQRQTWRGENLSGTYFGGLSANATACSDVANGPVNLLGTMSVNHNTSSQAVSITLNTSTASGTSSVCTFNGIYSQQGKLGSVNGNWSCTIAGSPYNNGTFTITDLQSTIRGFNGGFVGQDQHCQYAGNFGNVRQ